MKHKLDYQVNQAEVRRYLGYQSGQTEKSDRVDQLINRSISAVGERAEPRGIVKTCFRNELPGGVLALPGSDLLLSSRDLAELLAGCSLVSLLVVTLGQQVDDYVSDLLSTGQYAAAAVADAIGSDAAEQAMVLLDGKLRQAAVALGFGLTRRFSPGYGDVPLELQRDLLRLLEAKSIGVRLTESNLMVPQKSVTALLGWRAGACADNDSDKCTACQKHDCRFRRRPGDCDQREKVNA